MKFAYTGRHHRDALNNINKSPNSRYSCHSDSMYDMNYFFYNSIIVLKRSKIDLIFIDSILLCFIMPLLCFLIILRHS